MSGGLKAGYPGLVLALAAWLALCSLFAAYCGHLTARSPDVTLFTAAEPTDITFAELTGDQGYALRTVGELSGAARGRAQAAAAAEGLPESCELWRVDGLFSRFMGLRTACGALIDSWHVQKGAQCAAIGETLAHRLFMSLDVTGELIYIDGAPYEIVGVIDEDDSLPGRLAGGEFPQVYIPYTAAAPYAKQSISFMAILGEKTPAAVRIAVQNVFRGGEAAFELSSPLRDAGYATQLYRLLALVAALWCVILAARVLMKLAGRFCRWTRVQMDELYPGGLLRERAGGLLWRVGVLLALAALMALLLYFGLFEIMIRHEFLPQDNIFDIGFYVDAIVAAAQRANSSGAVYSPADILVSRSFGLMLGLAGAGAALWFVLCGRVKRAACAGQPKRFALCCALGLALGAPLGLLMCAGAGLDIAISLAGAGLAALACAAYAALRALGQGDGGL